MARLLEEFAKDLDVFPHSIFRFLTERRSIANIEAPQEK